MRWQMGGGSAVASAVSREQTSRPRELDREESLIARVVRDGLQRRDKRLPPWLFYDAEGSRIYERITELPEYYPTRAERSIFVERADAIVAAAVDGTSARLAVAELGAGTATKSQLLLRALVRRQGMSTFMPTDISWSPLAYAVARFGREEPLVEMRPIVGRHDQALRAIRRLEDRQLVMFIGSSIGNFDDAEARDLLRDIRKALRTGGTLLLGTDLRKDPAVLVPAYDDAQGVTAAFNKNMLTRINRELGGHFELDRFRHVALWNDAASRIEMHLESLVDQVVHIDSLGAEIALRKGERIRTETSVKYDDRMVDALLGSTGFARAETFLDHEGRFAVHLAKAVDR